MALEKDSQCEPEFKKKLEDYQELKKQYHQQKQALSNEGLEQKSLTDPDSRRMKNNGECKILDLLTNYLYSRFLTCEFNQIFKK